ncbi:S-S bond formation pathway protein, partial [Monkeypox virus]
ILDDEIRRVLT